MIGATLRPQATILSEFELRSDTYSNGCVKLYSPKNKHGDNMFSNRFWITDMAITWQSI